jgi:hypothetical protein
MASLMWAALLPFRQCLAAFAEVPAAALLLALCEAPARIVDSLHLKVGMAMI